MSTDTTFDLSPRRDWPAAFAALRRLLADATDTPQVFRIMRSLNAGAAKAGYNRMLQTLAGGRIAYQRIELAEILSEPAILAGYADGSVGAAYRAFLQSTGYSAQALAAISRSDDSTREVEHPYAWYGRRMRDIHDIWHILTGYRADEPLGEACLVAFSYAQSGGLGWALIAVGAAVEGMRLPGGTTMVRAIWEGYRRGRRAVWLPAEDYASLLAEPLDRVRDRLRITAPTIYDAAWVVDRGAGDRP